MNQSDKFVIETHGLGKSFHHTIYQICIQGHLDERRLRWFEGLEISLHPDGVTVISGAMDQSALHGILNRIRDLSLDLISVQRTISNDDSNIEGKSQ